MHLSQPGPHKDHEVKWLLSIVCQAGKSGRTFYNHWQQQHSFTLTHYILLFMTTWITYCQPPASLNIRLKFLCLGLRVRSYHQHICYQGSGQCGCEQSNLLLLVLPSCSWSLLTGQMEDDHSIEVWVSHSDASHSLFFKKHILGDIRKQNDTMSWHLGICCWKICSNSSEKQARGENCTVNTSVAASLSTNLSLSN